MVVQEMEPVFLTPLSMAGAGFYILVFLITENLVETWLGRGGRYGGFRSLIRTEPPRGQESEVDQKMKQLKERVFMIGHAITCSSIAIGTIYETYGSKVLQRTSYLVEYHGFLFWYFVVSMLYLKDPSLQFAPLNVIFWRTVVSKRYMIYQFIVNFVTFNTLNAIDNPYLHMSIGCIVLTQEISSVLISVVTILQLVGDLRSTPRAANVPTRSPQSAMKRRRHLSGRKQSFNKFFKNRFLAKFYTPFSLLCHYIIYCLNRVLSYFSIILRPIFMPIISRYCLHPYSRYIVLSFLTSFTFAFRIALVPLLYLSYFGVSYNVLLRTIDPFELMAAGVYVAIQIYWFVDANYIILKYEDMVDKIKQDVKQDQIQDEDGEDEDDKED